jgi:hypothetical protein
MAWIKITAKTKMDSSRPTMRFYASGIACNALAVQMVGKKSTRCIILWDAENGRLGFVFFNSAMKDSFTFQTRKNIMGRFIACKKFIRESDILKLIGSEREFPLQQLDERIPGFEGTKIYSIKFNKQEEKKS